MANKVLRHDKDGQPIWVDKATIKPHGPPPTVLANDVGCIAQQVDEVREDAKAAGFSGIEWRPDPTTLLDGQPTFYQAYSTSRAEYERYCKYRGLSDRNGKNGSGASLTPGDLEAAAERVRLSLEDRDRMLDYVHTHFPETED